MAIVNFGASRFLSFHASERRACSCGLTGTLGRENTLRQ